MTSHSHHLLLVVEREFSSGFGTPANHKQGMKYIGVHLHAVFFSVIPDFKIILRIFLKKGTNTYNTPETQFLETTK